MTIDIDALEATAKAATPGPEPEFQFGDKVEVSDSGYCWKKAVYLRYSLGTTYPYRVHVEADPDVSAWRYCRKADW